MSNWSWIFGRSSVIGRALNRPRLRARTDQRANLPVAIIFGVGIGVYTFQPALKEAAEIVQQQANSNTHQASGAAATTTTTKTPIEENTGSGGSS